MSLTTTQREVYDYCAKNEFVSAHKIEELSASLNSEGNISTLSYALEKFRRSTCPKCNAEGAFKWHFMGKHMHPEAVSLGISVLVLTQPTNSKACFVQG
jgi:hypothetical protein